MRSFDGVNWLPAYTERARMFSMPDSDKALESEAGVEYALMINLDYVTINYRISQ